MHCFMNKLVTLPVVTSSSKKKKMMFEKIPLLLGPTSLAASRVLRIRSQL